MPQTTKDFFLHRKQGPLTSIMERAITTTELEKKNIYSCEIVLRERLDNFQEGPLWAVRTMNDKCFLRMKWLILPLPYLFMNDCNLCICLFCIYVFDICWNTVYVIRNIKLYLFNKIYLRFINV